MKRTWPQDVASAGARRLLINLSAKLPAIFIKEGIYVDNSGLEYDGEVIEDNVFNVLYKCRLMMCTRTGPLGLRVLVSNYTLLRKT